MKYDEEIAFRVRELMLPFGDDIQEKKMFGGLSFLYKGKMTVGVVADNLAVRIVAEKINAYLVQDAVRPMDFTGKPLKEFVYVSADGFAKDEELKGWVNLGIEHAKRKLGED